MVYFPARDEIISVDRTASDEKIAAEKNKAKKLSGLLLADDGVLRAMDPEAPENARFLPVERNKDGMLKGSVAADEDFERLGCYVQDLLHGIVREIRDGIIDADPAAENEDNLPCRYCKWKNACCFQEGRDADRIRLIEKVDRESFLQKLAEQERIGEEGDR